jgi:hypothetical protein
VELFEATGGPGKPKGKPTPPDLAEWDPSVELLAAVHDRLGAIVQAVVASAGSKKKIQMRPWPRPEGARQLWERDKARRNFSHLESVITYVPTDEWLTEHPPPAPPATSTTATAERVPPAGGLITERG